MSKVFLISQSFPPVGGSHATRTSALWGILVKKYDSRGISIDVGKGYPILNDEKVDSNLISRVFPGIFHYLAHSRVRDNNRAIAGDKKSIKSKIFSLIYNFYRSIEIIDSYFDWIPHLAIKMREEVKSGDIIVSMSMPNSVHVGVLLGMLGKKNKWIADFADPWTLDRSTKKNKIKRAIERYIEHQIIRRADVIYFATELTLADYKKNYSKYSGKMSLARMGHERNSVGNSILNKDTAFYGGSLPAENRNASELLSIINNLTDIKFIFAGPCCEDISRYFMNKVPDNIRLIPWLSHHDYLNMLRSSEVSIIFGNSNYQQIPGKVLQCIGFSNKILYISNMDPEIDESILLLRDLPGVVISENISEKIENDLRNIMSMDDFSDNARGDELEWENTIAPIISSIDLYIKNESNL